MNRSNFDPPRTHADRRRCLVSLAATGAALAFTSTRALTAPSSAVRESQFLFDQAPFASCHASTLVEVAPGRLLAAFFAGTAEMNPDVGIWVARRGADGRWSTPVEVANGKLEGQPRVPSWNPVLFQARDGDLQLYYKLGPTPQTWWGMVIRSRDGGLNWSRPKRLPDGVLGPIKNKPIRLSDGTVIAGSSTESATQGWRVHFEISKDEGRNWTALAPLDEAGRFNAIQPSLLTLEGGVLAAVVRTQEGAICRTTSNDLGRHWGPLQATNLPNPNAGIDAVTLRDGRQLIVYNDSMDPSRRTPLRIGLSRDASNWTPATVLDDGPGEFSYPSVIQTVDRKVHIAWTWNRSRIRHVVVDPAAL